MYLLYYMYLIYDTVCIQYQLNRELGLDGNLGGVNDVELRFLGGQVAAHLGRQLVLQLRDAPGAVDDTHAIGLHVARHVLIPECVARVPVSFGGLGVRLCSRKVASVFPTVRNRPRECGKALHNGECVWSGPERVSS